MRTTLSGEPWTDAARIALGNAYLERMANQPHDAHVLAYRSFVRAYGSREGYYLEMARQARSVAKLMQTAEGRAFIAKRNADDATYRALRSTLPF